ncbi:TPA: phage tail tape measure protein [Morganella morganii]|nr:phage tail tape measure protein [Morganella morganii]HCR3761922.1 phage tail tape measure protein [Morganella morganii]HCT5326622.1 phage tail tape measure protein [Morganella morganii]
MAREFKLSLLLSARDEASKSITRSLRETVKETQKAEQAQEKLNRRQKTTAQDAISQGRARTEDMKRQSRAYETLGIRSERAIQREISQTIAAYNRLARSGMMSADEQARAFDRMRQRVGQLRGEMKQMSNMKIGNIANGFVTAAGGLYAGAQAFAEPVKRQMSYEERLAYMTNTAFSDRNAEGRIEGIKELDGLVRNAVQQGGGTKESAADLLDKMLAKGVFSTDEIYRMMPDLQAYGTMSQVSGEELATMVEALKDFGISDPDKVMKALDMSIKAGQEGAFEFTNMARWLPKQLASAKVLGYDNLDGYAKILSYNQGAMATAGSQDEAGNNLSNLLSKLISSDLVSTAKGIKVDGYGIDITKTLLNAREKGIDPVTAVVKLTDVIASQNPEFKRLQGEIAKTKENSPERQRLLESQNRILEGSAVGQLITDQQARMALLALRARQDYVKNVEAEVNKQQFAAPGQGEGAIQKEVLFSRNSFKVQQAKNQAEFAEMDSVKPISDVVGTLSEQFTQLSKDFPVFTSALMGAKTGIEAMTQAAVAFAALKFLFGGRGGKGSGLGRGGSSGGVDGVFDTVTGGDAVPVRVTNWSGAPGGNGDNGFKFGDFMGKYGQIIDLVNEVDDEKLEETRNKITDKTDKKYIDAGIDPKEKNGWIPTDAHIWWKNLGRDDADIRKKRDELMSVPAYGAPLSPEDIAKTSASVAVNALSELIKNQQKAPLPIELRSVVELDGHVIAETVNNINGNDAGRTTGGGL